MLFRKRTCALFVGSVALLLVANPTRHALSVGLPFVFAGQMVRLWSSGYLTKMERLVTAGPFALCRNPLYVGSFLITVGYLAMCNHLIVALVGVAVFWLFHAGAIAHEERMLLESFGDDYAAYRSKVPRFIPRLHSLAGNGAFSLKQLVHNNEYRGLVGAACVCALFVLMAYRVIPPPLDQLARLLRR